VRFGDYLSFQIFWNDDVVVHVKEKRGGRRSWLLPSL